MLYIGNHLIEADETISGSCTIKFGTKCIADSAFSGCTSLKSITIPDSVTSIDGDVFRNCVSLESITIPDSVTSIGDSVFQGCTSLESITIPDSVANIGSSAFYNCTSLESITIPDSVTSIGDYAFEGCTSLKSVTIPDSVKSIDYSAFRGCTSLESVIIGDGVTSIYSNTFYNCTSLESIAIPDSVTSIDRDAFANCKSLSDVYYTGTKEQWGKISVDSEDSGNDSLKNATIHYNSTVCDMSHTYSKGVCTMCGDWNGTEKEVKLKSATNVTGGVKISWSKLEGAEKYIIYRKTSSKAEWKKLYTTKTAPSAYTDKTAKSGTKYYYTVKAVRDGEYSKYDKDGVSRTFIDAPASVKVVNKKTCTQISWKKVTGATRYDIYRRVKGGSWKKLYTTKTAATSYNDKSAKAGVIYDYKVRARVGSSTTSAFSSEKRIVRMTVPALKSISATSGKVTLTFGKVEGATSYAIYRKTGSGSYKKIATTTSTKYVDKSVKKGTTYTYTVKAVRSSYTSYYNTTGLKVKAK